MSDLRAATSTNILRRFLFFVALTELGFALALYYFIQETEPADKSVYGLVPHHFLIAMSAILTAFLGAVSDNHEGERRAVPWTEGAVILMGGAGAFVSWWVKAYPLNLPRDWSLFLSFWGLIFVFGALAYLYQRRAHRLKSAGQTDSYEERAGPETQVAYGPALQAFAILMLAGVLAAYLFLGDSYSKPSDNVYSNDKVEGGQGAVVEVQSAKAFLLTPTEAFQDNWLLLVLYFVLLAFQAWVLSYLAIGARISMAIFQRGGGEFPFPYNLFNLLRRIFADFWQWGLAVLGLAAVTGMVWAIATGLLPFDAYVAIVVAAVICLLLGLGWLIVNISPSWRNALVFGMLVALLLVAAGVAGLFLTDLLCQTLPVCQWRPDLAFGSPFEKEWPSRVWWILGTSGAALVLLTVLSVRGRIPGIRPVGGILFPLAYLLVLAFLARAVCACDTYDPRTNQCAPLAPCGENASRDGCDCVCDEGFTRNDEGQCVPPPPPPPPQYEFSYLDLKGAHWICANTAILPGGEDKSLAYCTGRQDDPKAYLSLAGSAARDASTLLASLRMEAWQGRDVCAADKLIAIGNASPAGPERFDPNHLVNLNQGLSKARAQNLKLALNQQCGGSEIPKVIGIHLGQGQCPVTKDSRGLCPVGTGTGELDPETDLSYRGVAVIAVKDPENTLNTNARLKEALDAFLEKPDATKPVIFDLYKHGEYDIEEWEFVAPINAAGSTY